MCKSDIQIAQEANMEKITKIADKIGLKDDEIELYGNYKCKISKSTHLWSNKILNMACHKQFK